MAAVPGRNCGSCTVCCTVKTIAAPTLIKAPGVTCEHCDRSGCGVYETRPEVCRDYACVYLASDWLNDRQRPDRCGVLIDVGAEADHRPYDAAFTVHAYREPARLLAQPFPEIIASLIAQGAAVFLSRPGPPGSMNALLLLNATMGGACQANDMVSVRIGLEEAVARLDAHAFAPFRREDAEARIAAGL